MKFTLPLKALNRSDVSIAGGKGASLGELLNAGIPVPEGFVILTKAFDTFLRINNLEKKINLILSNIDPQKIEEINSASRKIKQLIVKSKLPKDIYGEILSEFEKLNAKYVAVRSSATTEDSTSAAWAGQLETFLNTPKDKLIKNIIECWASLFSPKAISYKLQQKLNSRKISVAVVIQKMIDADKSGIAFSVHPVTHNKNHLLIEAIWGLGEAIVSGHITPDYYIVDKEKQKIVEKKLNKQTKELYRSKDEKTEWKVIAKEKIKKQILSEKEINELSKIVIKIEELFDFPVDVEWANKDKKFYILQSRPITTIKAVPKIKRKEWINTISREMSLTAVYYPLVAVSRDVVFNYNCTDSFYFSRQRFVKGYKSKEDDIKTLNEIKRIVSEGKLMVVLNEFKEIIKTRIKLSSKFISTNLDLLEKKKIIALFNEFHELYIKYWQYHIFAFNLGRALENTKYNYLLEKHHNLIKEVRSHHPFLFFDEEFLPHLYKWITKRYKIDQSYLFYLTPKELVHVIENQIIKKEELEKRRRYYLAEISDNKVVVRSGDSAYEEYLRRIGPENIIKPTSSIKGRVAYKGTVIGRAKVILFRKDLKKIQDNSILVAPQTTPDVVPYLKKVKGIITDEGGITSHAAIISREYKIPCIIGTSTATKIIKDNDLVLIDGEKGEVKILERHI